MVTIINFSSRQNGNCHSVSKLVSEQYPEVQLFEFSNIIASGCGRCEYQCFKDEKCIINDSINDIYQHIIDSEIAYFIIPNYCDYPSSNYFIFNERSCGFFQSNEELKEKYLAVRKKFIVVTNTNINIFKDILKSQIRENDKLDILFLSSRKFSSVALDGDLMNSSNAQNIVRNFVQNHYKIEESCMAVVLCKDSILTTTELIYEREVLSLPKGHIEKGETHIEVAIRECFEETNLSISKNNVVRELEPFTYEFVDHHYDLVRKTIYPVIFKVNDYKGLISKEERIKEIKFMNIIDFYSQCSYEDVRGIIRKVMNSNIN